MKRFKNILCVVDLDSDNEDGSAITRAIKLAQNNQAQLTILASLERKEGLLDIAFGEKKGKAVFNELLDEKSSALSKLVAKSNPEKVNVVTKVVIGQLYIEAIREVLQNQIDLLIKRPGTVAWLERLFGNDDMHLLRKCPCPVMMVKPNSAVSFETVLAAIDVETEILSDPVVVNEVHSMNLNIAELSCAVALAESAQLHFANAWNPFGEDFLRYGAFSQLPEEEVNRYVDHIRQLSSEKLNDLIDDVKSGAGAEAIAYLKPQLHLEKGDAIKEIPELVKKLDVDLLVMGTLSRSGVSGFTIGNTAEAILSQVHCSVLAIKPPGFKSSVTL